MQNTTISDIQKKYDLELDKMEATIKKQKAKTVLLQFPEGMKPYATTIADKLKETNPDTEFLIWSGTCFGACDTPQINDDIDLTIQFGHSSWKYD